MSGHSFLGSKEHNRNKHNIRIEDLKTQPQVRDVLLLNVTKQLSQYKELDVTDSPYYKSLAKSLQPNDIRKQLSERLQNYKEPKYSEQKLIESHMRYHEERRNRNEQIHYGSIRDIITRNKDGMAYGWSYEEGDTFKLQFQSVIQPRLFINCKHSYMGFNSKKPIIQPVSSLIAYIEKSEDLGITYDDLSQVLKLYAQEIMPEISGHMMIGHNETNRNYEHILNFLNISKEQRTIQDLLKQVSRKPGQEIIQFFQPLMNLYTAYLNLKTIN